MIFGKKKIFLFFDNNFARINHCKFIYLKSHLKPFLSYPPCIVHREYFSIIFNVKKCALYSIKYSKLFGTMKSTVHILPLQYRFSDYTFRANPKLPPILGFLGIQLNKALLLDNNKQLWKCQNSPVCWLKFEQLPIFQQNMTV
jgi:hypothetical protein